LIQKYNLKQGVNGQDNSIYASMVSSVDENIGRILDTIDESNIKENTLIIFTSDNGGIRAISNQYPLRAGKGSYYEGGIRVPFFMRWPNKIDAGINKVTNISHLDIYSTLQEIVNPKIRVKQLDGINLKSQFKGPSKLERDIFYHFPIYLEAYNKIEDHGRDPLFRTRPGSVIISGKWKLHHYFEDDGTELYNLETDIGESNDLNDKEPEITKRLKQSLENWRLKENAFIPNEKNPFYNSIF
jgi:arylsulfatase A-like enzyme